MRCSSSLDTRELFSLLALDIHLRTVASSVGKIQVLLANKFLSIISTDSDLFRQSTFHFR